MKNIIVILVFILVLIVSAGSYSRKCRKGEGPRGFAWKKNHWARYGHWCGPGYLGINSCYKDELDRVCMVHDLCERRNVLQGRAAHSCACDLQFIRAAHRLGGVRAYFFAKILRQRNTRKCLSRQ